MPDKSIFVELKGNVVRNFQERVAYRAELRKCSVPLGLRSVGYAEFPSGRSSSLRKIDFIQILWTVSGCGYVKIGDSDYPLKEGWAAFCFPESKHLLRAGNLPWKYHWCTFDGQFAVALAAAFQAPRKPFFAGACRPDLFEKLEAKLKDPSLDGEREASAEAYQFLALMTAKSSSCGKRANQDRLSRILAKISLNAGDPDLAMKQLSEDTGLSRFSIHRIFKAELGISPKKYIDSLRLRKSMELLRESSLNIDEIALLAGFSNANYFAKFFRKKTSFSPSQFRESAHMP